MIDHRAVLDEIIKIGESVDTKISNRDKLVSALKTVGIAGAGGALGVGAAHAMERAFPEFMQATKPVKSNYVRAVQIGLPILSAVGLSLGSKYRQLVDQGLSGTNKK